MPRMYDISIPPLALALSNLSHILKKGEAHADALKLEHGILLNDRLFPDMYPLTRQVQIATDMSKGAGARLAGVDVPKYEDNETTFDELEQRISKTIAFLNGIKPEELEGAETRHVEIMIRNSKREFVGLDYLLRWVQPNLYFHVTTTYNILRHNGVELSKRDFLGPK